MIKNFKGSQGEKDGNLQKYPHELSADFLETV